MTNALTSAGVQYGSISLGSGQTSATATISSVGSGAVIHFLGQTSGNAGLNGTIGIGRVELTNGTTVTASRNAASATNLTLYFCVVDGDTTNFIKSVQSGTVAVANSATGGTASVGAVTNANAAVHYLGLVNTNTSN